MKRRTQAQWLSLFTEHEVSGLKAIEFCKEHAICPNYFSKRKTQLLTVQKTTEESTFIPVQLNTAQPSSQIALQYKNTIIKIPITIDAHWLAHFIKALQA